MPILGRFGDTSGRPYLQGRLLFPRLELHTDVSFLVDTGADECVLMPADAIRSGMEYSRLGGEQEIIGASGTSKMFVEDAIAVFAEPGVGLHCYTIDVLVAPAARDLERIPSLLGRSVLDRWRMVYNPSHKLLVFDVVTTDLTLPAGARPPF